MSAIDRSLQLYDDILNDNTTDFILYDSEEFLSKQIIKNSQKSRYLKTKSTYVNVDSRDRDSTEWPDVYHYKVKFDIPFKNVKQIKLISTEFPKSKNILIEHPDEFANNRIVWRLKDGYYGTNIDEDDGTDDSIYAVRVPSGNYSSSELAQEIETRLSSIWDYKKEKYQEFDVFLEESKDILRIDSHETYASENSFRLNPQQINEIDYYPPGITSIDTIDRGTVTPQNGDLLVIKDVPSDLLGIDVETINGYHQATYETTNIPNDTPTIYSYLGVTTTTLAVPANIYSIRIQCWGAGGGSARLAPATGGSYAESTFIAEDWMAGSTLHIQCGAGGGRNKGVDKSVVASGGSSWYGASVAGGSSGGGGSVVASFDGSIYTLRVCAGGGGGCGGNGSSIPAPSGSDGVGGVSVTGGGNGQDSQLTAATFNGLGGDGGDGEYNPNPVNAGGGGGGGWGGGAGGAGYYNREYGGQGDSYGTITDIATNGAYNATGTTQDNYISPYGNAYVTVDTANGSDGMVAITFYTTESINNYILNVSAASNKLLYGAPYGNLHVGWPRRVKFFWESESNNIADIIDFNKVDTDYYYSHSNDIDITKTATGMQMIPYRETTLDGTDVVTHRLFPKDIIIEHNAFDVPLADGDFIYLPPLTSETCGSLNLNTNGLTDMVASFEQGYAVKTFYNENLQAYLDGTTGVSGDFVNYWNKWSQSIIQGGTTGGEDLSSLVTGVTYSGWSDFAEHHFYISMDDSKRFYGDTPDAFDGTQCGSLTVKENNILDIDSEKLVYMVMEQYGTMKFQDKVDDVLAKIQLSADSGAILFNTFISTPVVFVESPLRELSELVFSFRNKDNSYYQFLDKEHSFTIEIIEYVDIHDKSQLSSVRGVDDKLIYL
jgi:hypothetical protein